MLSQQLQFVKSEKDLKKIQSQTQKNSKFEKGRRQYEAGIQQLFNDPTYAVTDANYAQALASERQILSNQLNGQYNALYNVEGNSKQTQEQIELIMKNIIQLSNKIDNVDKKQDVIMNRQISIHNDVKSYGNKTLNGIKDIKSQGGDIFNKCFPPKGPRMMIVCFNQMFVLILKLLQFIFSLYYNTSYLCINIGKTTLGKIPLFGLLLAPLFELCATIVFVWLTMIIVTKSSKNTIDAKKILISSIRFLRYILQYVYYVVNDNIDSLFTDIKDVFTESGLNEDAEKIQSYLSSIKVVQYADATLSSINDAAANLQYTKETVSYVYESLPNIGLEYGISSLFSKASYAITGGNNQRDTHLNTIQPEAIEELGASNMKELFGQTGGIITNIVEVITRTVRLFNDLSPEARIIMNEYLQKNKTKSLEYVLNKDIRKNSLYKAYSSLFILNQNKKLLNGGKSITKTKSKTRTKSKSGSKNTTRKSLRKSRKKSNKKSKSRSKTRNN